MRTKIFALLLVGFMATTAVGQYSSDFEALTADADGEILTGQDGYYIPAGTNSVDYLAYTYAGNTLGIPANPGGGDQFVAGTGPGDPGGGTLFFARAQRDVSYAGANVWTVSYDICVTFTGELPTAQNTGSLSTQLFPGEATFIQLVRWSDINTATNWNADAVWFDEAGTQLTEEIPDPGFQNFDVDHWYRQSATFDLVSNRVLEVSVTDLTTSTTVTYNPPDRYLEGGAAGGSPPPSGFRFFAGGGVAGNTLAWDNIDIAPTPMGGFCPPTSFNRFRGTDVGTPVLEDFVDSDDVYASYNPGFVLNSAEAPVWLEFFANCPTAIDILVESNAGTPGLTYTVDAWNYSTSSYDELGTMAETFNADTVGTFALTSGDQIDANGDVRSRVGWRKTGLTINFPWQVNIDQAGWNQ